MVLTTIQYLDRIGPVDGEEHDDHHLLRRADERPQHAVGRFAVNNEEQNKQADAEEKSEDGPHDGQCHVFWARAAWRRVLGTSVVVVTNCAQRAVVADQAIVPRVVPTDASAVDGAPEKCPIVATLAPRVGFKAHRGKSIAVSRTVEPVGANGALTSGAVAAFTTNTRRGVCEGSFVGAAWLAGRGAWGVAELTDSAW